MTASPPGIPTPKRRLTWWQILLLVVVWPLGVAYLTIWIWRNSAWPTPAKIGVTLLVGVVTLLAIPINAGMILAATGQTSQIAVEPPSAAAPAATTTTPIPAPATTVVTPTEETTSATAAGTSPIQTPAELPKTPTAPPSAPAPGVSVFKIAKYGLAVKYPTGWQVVRADDKDSGAQIFDPKSKAELWVVVSSGQDRFADTPTEEAKGISENINGNGGQVTQFRADSGSYEVRGVVDDEVRWYFGSVGQNQDYTSEWTFPESMAGSLDPIVQLSNDSFIAD